MASSKPASSALSLSRAALDMPSTQDCTRERGGSSAPSVSVSASACARERFRPPCAPDPGALDELPLAVSVSPIGRLEEALCKMAVRSWLCSMPGGSGG